MSSSELLSRIEAAKRAVSAQTALMHREFGRATSKWKSDGTRVTPGGHRDFGRHHARTRRAVSRRRLFQRGADARRRADSGDETFRLGARSDRRHEQLCDGHCALRYFAGPARTRSAGLRRGVRPGAAQAHSRRTRVRRVGWRTRGAREDRAAAGAEHDRISQPVRQTLRAARADAGGELQDPRPRQQHAPSRLRGRRHPRRHGGPQRENLGHRGGGAAVSRGRRRSAVSQRRTISACVSSTSRWAGFFTWPATGPCARSCASCCMLRNRQSCFSDNSSFYGSC